MGDVKRKGIHSAPNDVTPLLAPLSALQKLLGHFDDQGVIILLSIDHIPELIDAAGEQGITPHIADAESFARENRVLLLRHQASGTNIDIE